MNAEPVVDPRMLELATAVTRQARRARESTRARDAAIVAMRDHGASLQAIAYAAGLTKPGVARVLKRAVR